MVVNKILRAKQFLPFDALKGLQEELRKKEIEYEEKKYLSEETLTELNDSFNQIEKGSYVKIKYYKNKKYKEIKGTVTDINYIKKKIEINKSENINIADITNINRIDL